MADPKDHGYHAPAFSVLVNDAKTRIRETTIEEYKAALESGRPLVLVDIREDHEWDAGRIPGAVHIGRGILERDVEKHFPDKAAPLVLQCGGGYRSALSADNLQKMGYTQVSSLAEGIRGWLARGLPVTKG